MNARRLLALTLTLTGAIGVVMPGCASIPDGAPAEPASARTPSQRASEPFSPMPGANTADAPTAVTVVIRIGDQRLTGTLADSPATRDLVAQLPLTLTMSDHGSVEKVAALPDPLATDGAPDGADPAVGDIGYYAPWNNLVLYYGNQSYHDGIVRLGTLAGDLTAVAGRGDVSVSLERSPE